VPLALGACTDSGGDAGASGDAEMRGGSHMAEARALQDRIITIDTHDDIPADFGSDEVNPCTELDRQVDVPKMEEGGLDVAFFIVYVGQGERTPEGYEDARRQAMQKFAGIHRVAEELCPERIELAYTPEDVERIVGEGKLATAIGIENGYVIGRDLSLLRTYSDLGANYITLAHGGHNDIADSATPREELGDEESEHGGLSPFGEEVVGEMNRLGIMVDVSHISKDAALDAMRVSSLPVIASHSSVRALADHPRNMDDETLRALRDNGGVIQIVALDGYVKVDPPEKTEAVDALREEMGIQSRGDWQALTDSARGAYEERMEEIEDRWPGPDVADFVDHIDYAVDLIGIDHVGISSDFDGGGGITGWNDASETVNVTAELLRRGYSDEEIEKLWGGNLLRVWGEVEAAAGEAMPADSGASG
jgi:membrane dipeptidase